MFDTEIEKLAPYVARDPVMDRPDRCGKFHLHSPDTRRQEWINRAILIGCVVVKAEMDWASRTIVYHALHPDFDPVASGEAYGEYVTDVVIEKANNNDGSSTEIVKSVTWRRVADLGRLGAMAAFDAQKG